MCYGGKDNDRRVHWSEEVPPEEVTFELRSCVEEKTVKQKSKLKSVPGGREREREKVKERTKQ